MASSSGIQVLRELLKTGMLPRYVCNFNIVFKLADDHSIPQLSVADQELVHLLVRKLCKDPSFRHDLKHRSLGDCPSTVVDISMRLLADGTRKVYPYSWVIPRKQKDVKCWVSAQEFLDTVFPNRSIEEVHT
jgi:hypothetical protein